jgi:hypothetical protein
MLNMSCAGELDAAEPGSIDESLTPKLQVLGHVDNVQDAVKTLSPLPSTPWYSTGLPHRLQNYMQHHHCGGSDSGDETQESLKALSSDEMDSDSHSSSSNEDTEADSFSGGPAQHHSLNVISAPSSGHQLSHSLCTLQRPATLV